ncbi:circadian clock protein KaiA [Oscillatoriales cyanobacterium USR001]|nr:circadian clock protein KaiA [Oscillatoriales cyanobacterium USR001]
MFSVILCFTKESLKLSDTTSGNTAINSNTVLPSQLSICIFLPSEELTGLAIELLGNDCYVLTRCKSPKGFLGFIERNSNLDCLILQISPELPLILSELQKHSIFLPTVILEAETNSESANISPENTTNTEEGSAPEHANFFYHAAEVYLPIAQLEQLVPSIDQAMTQFLNLCVPIRATGTASTSDPTAELTSQSLLHRQQRRLAEKLRERLGYLGVYYKRNSQFFFRNLPPTERQKLLDQLKSDYREIVLNYFSPDSTLNNKIDEFVNVCFFADISVTQVVEIHMKLMDEFAKQLKLEGRSEEVLLDYRLTLIDAIAHLCEMYRRSIPRDS